MHWSPIRRSKPGAPIGTVYLLCFDRPYYHARHYLGWSGNVEQRLKDHSYGKGSPLLAAAKAAGITWKLARSWEKVTRETERRIKNRGSAVRICPLCQARAKTATAA